MKVLVVDDDLQGRFILRRMLESSGHDVFEAENGEDAVGQAMVRRPDAIVSDIMMPGCDGFQMCRLLAQDPRLDSIPVILCSAAFCATRDRELAAEVGAKAYLEKPIHAQDLYRTLESFSSDGLDADEFPSTRLSELEFAEKHSERLAAKLQDHAREMQVANDKLRRLDEAKDAFVSIASHELRTPIAILHGYFQLLKSSTVERNGDQLEFLDAMESSIDRLSSVTRRLLEMSELGNGDALHVERVWVAVPEFCQAIVEEMRPFWSARQLDVRLDSPLQLPRIRVVSWSFRQALVELIHNAIKFTEDGGSIIVSLTQHDDKFVVRVCDTGVGIPESERERSFHKFYEVGGTDKHTSANFVFMGGGLGLGLSMVLAVVRDHNGSIAIEDRADGLRGTVIHLELPIDSSW